MALLFYKKKSIYLEAKQSLFGSVWRLKMRVCQHGVQANEEAISQHKRWSCVFSWTGLTLIVFVRWFSNETALKARTDSLIWLTTGSTDMILTVCLIICQMKAYIYIYILQKLLSKVTYTWGWIQSKYLFNSELKVMPVFVFSW